MDEQLRAFLDTDVLLGYYGGDEGIGKLFDQSSLEKARYSISWIVVQELILRLDESKMSQVDLDQLAQMVEIVSNASMIDETKKRAESESMISIDPIPHVNDYLNLIAARRNRCDFFITNDPKLLDLHHVQSLQIVTPDAFLHLEAVA